MSMPIDDKSLQKLMNELYNTWWLKWKAKKLTDQEFDQALEEIEPMLTYGDEFPIARNLAITFMYELSARMRGEYTERERDKLLEIIEKHDGRREAQ